MQVNIHKRVKGTPQVIELPGREIPGLPNQGDYCFFAENPEMSGYVANLNFYWNEKNELSVTVMLS